jgi:hypothetical protein
VIVNVPAPTLTLTANPSSVLSGQTTTLTWNTTGATTCTASGAWTGTRIANGTEVSVPLTASSTYTLLCSGAGGSVQKSVLVTLQAPPPPPPTPTLQFTVNPTSISPGGSAILTWASSNVTDCAASGAWTGAKTLNGSASTGALSTTSIYALACAGAGGSASQSVTVTVVTPVPTVTFTATPTSVISGNSTTLNWSTTNATSCTASGAWSGVKTVTGSEVTNSLSAAADFTLSCQGPGGGASASLHVPVITLALPTVTLSANPTVVATGATTSLTWNTTGATSCTASGGWTGTRATSGSEASSAISVGTSFTLACSGAGGSATANVTVQAQPLVTLTSTASSLSGGGVAVLTWSAANATSCTASNGWSGAQELSGQQLVGPITVPTSYSLTCTGPGGSTSQSLTIGVLTPDPSGPSTEVRLTDVSFVALRGRVGHAGWYRDSDQPRIGGTPAACRVSISGATTSVIFELVDDSAGTHTALTMAPDPDGTGQTSVYQGTLILPASSFTVLVTATGTDGKIYRLASQHFTPSPIAAHFPASIATANAGDTLSLPISLSSYGASRVVHVTLTEASGTLTVLPTIPDQSVGTSGSQVTTTLVLPQSLPSPTILYITVTVTDSSDSTITNSSSLRLDVGTER